MITSSDLQKKAVKGDIAATLLAMNGMHEKNNMDAAVGSDGLPWCGGFVKKMFEVSGYGGALKGISNPLAVISYIEDGKKLDLVEKIKDKPPSIGSIITFKDMRHIGVVSKVNNDGSFEITQGNTTDMVRTLKYTMADFKNGHLDKEYLSAEKLDACNKKQNPNAPTLGDSKLLKEVPSLEQAQESIKKNGATNSYDAFSKAFGINKDKPEETDKNPMQNMFAQMLLAILMLASGQKMEAEKSATEAERRQTLEKLDNKLREVPTLPQQKPTPIKVESVSTNSPPPATPKVTAKVDATANRMGGRDWL